MAPSVWFTVLFAFRCTCLPVLHAEKLKRTVDCILGMDCNSDDLDKQNEVTGTQIFVPQDAQGIILAFLPSRDVVKLHSVCKSWRSLLCARMLWISSFSTVRKGWWCLSSAASSHKT